MEIRLGIVNGLIERRRGWFRLGRSLGFKWRPSTDLILFSERGVNEGRVLFGVRFTVFGPRPPERATAQRRA